MPADFSDIQSAMDAASTGDTVLVAPGTYVGNIEFLGKDITLESAEGPESTIIELDSSTAVIIGPNGTIREFTITGVVGSAVETHGFNSLIQGNIFVDNRSSGGGPGAAISENNASPEIDGNTFRNCICDSQRIGVVTFVNTSFPILTNNYFVDNPCTAINMTMPREAAPIVLNNTIVGNTVGIHVDARASASLHLYQNNILVDNRVGLEVSFSEPGDEPLFLNNLVFDNLDNYVGIPDLTGTDGNISEDPLFVDPVMADFRLQFGSPVIDAGANTDAPSEDFEGDPRPIDGDDDGFAVVDIGADEAPEGGILPDPHPDGDPVAGASGSGPSSPCFIATAAYGTPMAEEVNVLRRMRDAHMLNNALGTAFLDTYYRASPPIAVQVHKHPLLAAAVRTALHPIVALSPGNAGIFGMIVLLIALAIAKRTARA